ncbi:FAD-dependent monooxygenase [Paenibacillus humicola]|uniref:FAD-dependent monooxygenase n=1 Tax=Paenibacillus humicola TaxID=3110540 RepID=UPI00237AB004|nr:FAD-dependent monooxygenase [Paenibacillus humicola]
MKSPMRILISGSSIAGPALAYWLHRYGFDVTIVELAPALRKGGFGVDVRGAAVEVLRQMGVLEQVRAADTHMTGVYFVNGNGKVEGRLSEAGMGNRQDVDIEIMRDDLTGILYDLTQDAVRYIWNDSITGIRDTEEGAEVRFDRSEPQTFDLVIGADGLHSNVRTLTFGAEEQFKQTLGCFISIFTLDNYLNLDHRELLHSVPGKTVGMKSARSSAEAKGMFLFTPESMVFSRRDTGMQKELVADAFRHETGWETQRLLQAMHEADDFYFDEICQIRMPSWSKGRVALVGDAAYCPSPLSGQGTSLAIVGAFVLAGELKLANGDYAAAFAAYERHMRAFVEQNQKIGRMAAGGMIERSRFKIRLRNAMLRLPFVMSAMFRMMMRMIAKAANGIELKAYGDEPV